jgi:hypothetical protein
MDKLKAGLFADQAKANADIGPAATDCFGDPAVVLGAVSRLAIPKNLILALPSAGALFASNPRNFDLTSVFTDDREAEGCTARPSSHVANRRSEKPRPRTCFAARALPDSSLEFARCMPATCRRP